MESVSVMGPALTKLKVVAEEKQRGESCGGGEAERRQNAKNQIFLPIELNCLKTV